MTPAVPRRRLGVKTQKADQTDNREIPGRSRRTAGRAGRAAEDRRDVVAGPSGAAARDQGQGPGAHLRDGAGTPGSCAGTAGLTRMTGATASVAAPAEAVTSGSPTAISGLAGHGEAGHRAGLSKGTAKAVRDSFPALQPHPSHLHGSEGPAVVHFRPRFTSRLAGPGERAPAGPRHQFQGETR
jgi:hypothetical protein